MTTDGDSLDTNSQVNPISAVVSNSLPSVNRLLTCTPSGTHNPLDVQPFQSGSVPTVIYGQWNVNINSGYSNNITTTYPYILTQVEVNSSIGSGHSFQFLLYKCFASPFNQQVLYSIDLYNVVPISLILYDFNFIIETDAFIKITLMSDAPGALGSYRIYGMK